jgi:hypothetical protein
MLAARQTPASLRELMLAGHSASSCDLSISVQDLELDVHCMEQPSQCRDIKGLSDGEELQPSCSDSPLPPPLKFCKKSKKSEGLSDPGASCTPSSTLVYTRAIRKAMGQVVVKDEAALWSSSEVVRQVSIINVSQLMRAAIPDETQ